MEKSSFAMYLVAGKNCQFSMLNEILGASRGRDVGLGPWLRVHDDRDMVLNAVQMAEAQELSRGGQGQGSNARKSHRHGLCTSPCRGTLKTSSAEGIRRC